jgi:hypothetical protein
LAVVAGSFSSIVRDGLRTFAFRFMGDAGNWREAWTWIRYSRIGNDPVTGFPIFPNPTYSRLVTEANIKHFDPAIHIPSGRDL